MRDKYASVPPVPETRKFEIGEEVLNGAHAKAVVRDIIEDGRVYVLDVYVDKSRKKDGSELVVEERIVSWPNVLPLSARNLEVEKYTDDKYYPLSYQQRDIYGLLVMLYSEYGFDFDPDYQRDHVWELEDKVDLIDSILAKRDIGKFVINHRPWHDTEPLNEVIDGKQRLSAIKEFYEDGFRYKGKLFSELHPRDRATFEGKAVAVAITNELNRTEILKIFLAVNTTGRPQCLDHLENVKKLLEETK